MYALLVGINQYKNSHEVRSLGGCVNDIEAMREFLVSKFNVAEDDIRTLKNDEATHQAIKAAFREHLVSRARQWKESEADGAPAACFFHFSGHGSRAKDETRAKPSGFDETIVPHDSRTEGVYDIKDWELGDLLDELAQYSDNVTVVLDCCHSGSGTRNIDPNLAQARECPPDLRPQPTATRGARGGPTRAPRQSGWQTPDRYALLAACRADQEANEHTFYKGVSKGRHGALTYNLIRELTSMHPARRLTYRELGERVREAVQSLFVTQKPQFEGDIDREVFGGLRPARDAFLTVVDKRGGFIWINAGLSHGLTPGSLLKVYPPETRRAQDAGPELAILGVEEAGPVQSACRVTEGEKNLPINARVVMHQINYGDMRRRVVFDVPRQEILDRLRSSLADEGVRPYVVEAESGNPAELRVVLVNGQLQIQDKAGRLLVAPFALDDTDQVAADLAHIVRYKNALELRNTASHSELAGAVKLAIRRLSFDTKTQEPTAVETKPTKDNDLVLEVGDYLVIEVTNHSNQHLYFAVLAFDGGDWSVEPLYPRPGRPPEKLATRFCLGLSRDRAEQLQILPQRVPDDVTEFRETYKVIASVDEAEFEILRQPALKQPFATRALDSHRSLSPLGQLLDRAMTGGTRTALGSPPASAHDEWTTDQVEVVITRKPTDEIISRDLQGGKTTVLPAFQLEIEPPPDFDGRLRVLTAGQAKRSATDDPGNLRFPPGLAAFPDIFQPLGVAPTRAAGPTGRVIEIEADAASMRRVCEGTPLTLRFTGHGEKEPVLAIAYDGSFYYLAGRPAAGDNTLRVERLPIPAEDEPTTLPGKKGLGRTVKLYFYKLMDLPEVGLGVHRARFVSSERRQEFPREEDERSYAAPGGEVLLRPVRGQDIHPGQRVALFVHGFNSDSTGMISGLAQRLELERVHYDHVLTFDYETFNTRIEENGLILGNALRSVGFGLDGKVRLDIFSHGMGTLVVRSMVERDGGHEFVDRCFLAGPPNLGTRLAQAKALVPWLGSLLLNNPTTALPGLIVSWLLNKVSDDAVALADLHPDSDFLRLLNGSERKPVVPYYILAGRNEIPTDQTRSWSRFMAGMHRGLDSVVDAFFSDDHDLVIPVASMQTVRGGNYPGELLESEIVPCNHFDYFENAESVGRLLHWLRAP